MSPEAFGKPAGGDDVQEKRLQQNSLADNQTVEGTLIRGGKAGRRLNEGAEGFGEDEKIGKADGSVAIQIDQRVILPVAVLRAEMFREYQEVGESDATVAV